MKIIIEEGTPQQGPLRPKRKIMIRTPEKPHPPECA